MLGSIQTVIIVHLRKMAGGFNFSFRNIYKDSTMLPTAWLPLHNIYNNPLVQLSGVTRDPDVCIYGKEKTQIS